MADVYQIQFNVSATPVEKQQLADGSDYSYSVHSSIDKIISSSVIKSFGATSTKVVQATATLSATTDLGTATGISGSVNSLLIICTGVTGGGDFAVKIGVATNYTGSLTEVGDMILITDVETSQNTILASGISLTKATGTSIDIEVLVGLI